MHASLLLCGCVGVTVSVVSTNIAETSLTVRFPLVALVAVFLYHKRTTNTPPQNINTTHFAPLHHPHQQIDGIVYVVDPGFSKQKARGVHNTYRDR